ncbi:MAG: aldo/keto reductase [Longimicrobiales bacterium]
MKLALGTAQFGMAYGIANRGGRPDLAVVEEILGRARALGIDTLDTAIAYGDAEERLGRVGVSDLRVVTKIPGVPADVEDVAGWVVASIEGSLERLGVPRLHGVLLHRPGQLTGPAGADLLEGLDRLVGQGLADRVGVSVYGPEELDALPGGWRPGLVQAPLSLFDCRLADSGWLARLAGAGVEVHTRSCFLQGLLLMEPDARPSFVDAWADHFARYDAFVAERGITRVQAALGGVVARPGVDRVVVGVDHARQLDEGAGVASSPPSLPPSPLCCEDIGLIDPAQWPPTPRNDEVRT